ncbi:MAG: glycosyltransferase [Propionibacteriaceae bacterium]|jgi:1,2-diacylglycerol 3-beta-galactosyltransferase|nr:glycosyltransferase [Propionibacteriaceae bacterium]
MDKKRILFLFSDTGGGHRAATNAIIEGLELGHPGEFDCTMVDFLKYYSPRPWSFAPEIYQPLSHASAVWKMSYEAANSSSRSKAANRLAYPMLKKGARRMLAEHPADMVVSVHPMANWVLPRAMRHHPVPFVTVVTDMVSTHAFWYSNLADLIIVPTPEARNRGIRLGINPARFQVIGQPVSPIFGELTASKSELRQELGWDQKATVVLLVGGGDGMGPMRRVAKAINKAELPVTLVVVCGRNKDLRQELEAVDWRIPHQLLGFTDEMPRLMKASDIFLTKAGPGSISEAFISGLPIIMYACLPGQEEGNVDYVLDGQAGLWAPDRRAVVDALSYLIDDPIARVGMTAASKGLARPDAARQIGDALVAQLAAGCSHLPEGCDPED